MKMSNNDAHEIPNGESQNKNGKRKRMQTKYYIAENFGPWQKMRPTRLKTKGGIMDDAFDHVAELNTREPSVIMNEISGHSQEKTKSTLCQDAVDDTQQINFNFEKRLTPKISALPESNKITSPRKVLPSDVMENACDYVADLYKRLPNSSTDQKKEQLHKKQGSSPEKRKPTLCQDAVDDTEEISILFENIITPKIPALPDTNKITSNRKVIPRDTMDNACDYVANIYKRLRSSLTDEKKRQPHKKQGPSQKKLKSKSKTTPREKVDNYIKQKEKESKMEKGRFLSTDDEYLDAYCGEIVTNFFGEKLRPDDEEEGRMTGDSLVLRNEVQTSVTLKTQAAGDAGSSKQSTDSKKKIQTSTRSHVASGEPSMVVTEFYEANIVLTLESMKGLAPLEKLDGDLVDYAMYYYLRRLPNVTYLLANAWYRFLKDLEDDPLPEYKKRKFYQMATMRGKDTDLLGKDFMVIPICDGDHWIVVIICNPFPAEVDVDFACSLIKKGLNPSLVSKNLYNNWTDYNSNKRNAPMIFVLDSKQVFTRTLGPNVIHQMKPLHNQVVRHILKGLQNLHQIHWKETGRNLPVHEETFQWKDIEMKDTSKLLDRNDIYYRALDVPEQLNHKDCGVFIIGYVICFFEALQKRPKGYHMWLIYENLSHWFDFADIDSLRMLIYITIAKRCLEENPKRLNFLEFPFKKKKEKVE